MKIEDIILGLKNFDRTSLAKAITLLESSNPRDWATSTELLKKLKPQEEKKTFRVGISGPPGVGKSTLIEKVGLALVKKNLKVAVLAIDPSSEITGGSILGDKTRMEELSRSELSFIRPSPHRGHLGGVTSSLPGVILLCEQAGYDWIIIESVGVGQSEIELSKMVDYFCFISQAGGGDELQGIKKGILEYVDCILVNKSDRDQKIVNTSCQQFVSALKIVRPQQNIPVFSCSALTGLGIEEIVKHWVEVSQKDFKHKRENFLIHWFESLLESEFKKYIRHDLKALEILNQCKKDLKNQSLNPIEATTRFFKQIGLKNE